MNQIQRVEGAVEADFDVRAFRKCLGQYGTGVTVITADAGGTYVGVTANSFSSLSLDPPLILWSIGRTSRSFDAFQVASHFSVNILASDQIPVSQQFSSQAVDKFAGIDWSVGVTGSPVIGGALAHIECSIESRIDGGDHVILVGRVERFESFDASPLLFLQGRYGVGVDHPDTKVSKAGEAAAHNRPDGGDAFFFRLLFQGFYSMSEAFEHHRQAAGTSLPTLRVLVGVYENPGATLEEIMDIMHIGMLVAQDALTELLRHGDIERNATGRLYLTDKGRLRREEVTRREQEFEAQQMAGISRADIQAARRVLAAIAGRDEQLI